MQGDLTGIRKSREIWFSCWASRGKDTEERGCHPAVGLGCRISPQSPTSSRAETVPAAEEGVREAVKKASAAACSEAVDPVQWGPGIKVLSNTSGNAVRLSPSSFLKTQGK